MKSTLLALLILSATGCFSLSKEPPQLLPKLEESKGEDGLTTGTYTFRIFGIDEAFLALYNPSTGRLSHLYRTQATDNAADFWGVLKEDIRMTRESRYFAASSALNPQIFVKDRQTGKGSGSFRADVFRGDPEKMSAVGRNILFNVNEVIYQSENRTKESTTHILVEGTQEFHAVPVTADGDLLSFNFVDGLPQGRPGRRWISIQLEQDGSVPGSSKMGCVSNFAGKVLAGPLTEETEISAVCERQGRAGTYR
jgi:hypothetical protein